MSFVLSDLSLIHRLFNLLKIEFKKRKLWGKALLDPALLQGPVSLKPLHGPTGGPPIKLALVR